MNYYSIMGYKFKLERLTCQLFTATIALSIYNNMQRYELAYLTTPEVSEEELKNLIDKIGNFILDEQGVIDKTLTPSKRRLGYPIKKQREAFLVSLDFHLAAEKIENLKKKINSEGQILRHLVMVKRVSKKALAPQRHFIKKAPKASEKVHERISEPKKVELKEIDKKIEEILGE